mmetsp:Transcript_26236/g.84425  ORF Transcript_26236/g.84425 Transcript_26236/m.84425 type:complete len:275 (+) Transcript_26236:231-1055(+)
MRPPRQQPRCWTRRTTHPRCCATWRRGSFASSLARKVLRRRRSGSRSWSSCLPLLRMSPSSSSTTGLASWPCTATSRLSLARWGSQALPYSALMAWTCTRQPVACGAPPATSSARWTPRCPRWRRRCVTRLCWGRRRRRRRRCRTRPCSRWRCPRRAHLAAPGLGWACPTPCRSRWGPRCGCWRTWCAARSRARRARCRRSCARRRTSGRRRTCWTSCPSTWRPPSSCRGCAARCRRCFRSRCCACWRRRRRRWSAPGWTRRRSSCWSRPRRCP